MEWKIITDHLPNHNELVIIVHRSLNVEACIYKKYESKRFGFLDLFVPIEDMRNWDNYYLDDSIDWYRDVFSYDKVYVDAWTKFPSIPFQPERSKREDS